MVSATHGGRRCISAPQASSSATPPGSPLPCSTSSSGWRFATCSPRRHRPTAISLAVGMFWPVYLAVVVLFLAAMLLAAGAVILHGLIFDDDRPGDADGAYPPDDPYDAWDV